MPEKYTPEEIKKAKEQEMEEEGKHFEKEYREDRDEKERGLDWEREREEQRKRDIDKAERTLQAMEKAPDDAFLHVNYQYKYRAYASDELLPKKEAIEFLKRYSADPGDLQIFHGFNVLEILSAEEGRKYEERKEAELRAESKATEDEEAEEANKDRLYRLSIKPQAEIAFALDPKLESEMSLGIAEAMGFVDSLKESVEQPADYIGDRSKAGGMEKITHEGWSEHDDLKRAFQSAVKIESRISPAIASKGKKNYNVEVVFIDKNIKEIMAISTTFDEDGEQSGGISMSKP